MYGRARSRAISRGKRSLEYRCPVGHNRAPQKFRGKRDAEDSAAESKRKKQKSGHGRRRTTNESGRQEFGHPMIRTILLQVAASPRLAGWVTTNSITRSMARRFVAGETLDQAVEAARAMNCLGRMVSLDYLGESVANESEARLAGDTCVAILEKIASEKLDANISVKLTQLGLDVRTELCEEILARIVERAAAMNNFVRVDMEGSAYAQRTIDIVRRLRAKTPAVGTVVQAYLYRSEQDVKNLLAIGCRIRLCKGAYKEPADVAFPGKADVDENYVCLVHLLLPSGVYHGIATHDPMMISATKAFASQRKIGRQEFEFQMLYGIRTDLQEQLVKEGFRLRVYIPFGQDWFPYFMRRLAERPANLGFFLRQALRPSRQKSPARGA
jgi:proline dehydrogenase